MAGWAWRAASFPLLAVCPREARCLLPDHHRPRPNVDGGRKLDLECGTLADRSLRGNTDGWAREEAARRRCLRDRGEGTVALVKDICSRRIDEFRRACTRAHGNITVRRRLARMVQNHAASFLAC